MAENDPPFRKPGTTEKAEFHLVMVDGVPGRYSLQEPFEYVKPDYAAGPDGYVALAPSDVTTFRTDLASIPFFATWLVPRDGKHTPAALLHDSLYADARLIESKSEQVKALQEADWVFRGAMHVTGVPLVRRWLMWAAVAVATFSKGPLRRMLWGWFTIGITIAASLVFNLMAVNMIFDGSLEWAPKAAVAFLNWVHDTFDGMVTLLPKDLRWVPSPTIWQVGLIAMVSLVLWFRWIGAGLLAAGAVMLFGYPLLLAAWSFGIYWFIEAVIAFALRYRGRRHVNDVGILRTKRSAANA